MCYFTHDLLWGMVGDITQMTQILKLDNCNNSFLLSVMFQLSYPKSTKLTKLPDEFGMGRLYFL